MLPRPPSTLQINKRPELLRSHFLQFPRDFNNLPTKPTATFPLDVLHRSHLSALQITEWERCGGKRARSKLRHRSSNDLQEQNAATSTTETIWGTNCWRSWGSSWITEGSACAWFFWRRMSRNFLLIHPIVLNLYESHLGYFLIYSLGKLILINQTKERT